MAVGVLIAVGTHFGLLKERCFRFLRPQCAIFKVFPQRLYPCYRGVLSPAIMPIGEGYSGGRNACPAWVVWPGTSNLGPGISRVAGQAAGRRQGRGGGQKAGTPAGAGHCARVKQCRRLHRKQCRRPHRPRCWQAAARDWTSSPSRQARGGVVPLLLVIRPYLVTAVPQMRRPACAAACPAWSEGPGGGAAIPGAPAEWSAAQAGSRDPLAAV